MGRVLAIDYGTRRIGLALSDPARVIGAPFGTVDGRDQAAAVSAIVRVCREQEVDRILLGAPLSRDGEGTALSPETDWLAASLAAATGLPVERCDERFTSVEAGAVLHRLGRTGRTRGRRERKKGSRDQVAAALLLQDWINDHEE